jgi:LPXTG-motif cell wall-anchored protein
MKDLLEIVVYLVLGAAKAVFQLTFKSDDPTAGLILAGILAAIGIGALVVWKRRKKSQAQ